MESLSRLKKILIITCMGILLAATISYLTPLGRNIRTVLAETISTTRYQQFAWVFGVEISKKAPPLPKVIYSETEIPVFQSSYCWGNLGCADYVGGNTVLKEKTPTVVTPEANIKISFDYKPGPSELNVRQFLDKETSEVHLKDGTFIAPKENGVYYYVIAAAWKTDDGKFSKGDTSAVFVIEVR